MKRNVSRMLGPCALACLTGISALPQLSAQETEPSTARQIVVTATRMETPIDQVGSSITVLTADDLKQTQSQNMLDALRQVPGVIVSRSGGQGQTATIFLRGAPPGFTQVMVDGNKVNDPTGIGTMYDFGNFQIDNIERIEILRGPQSTLYGSDAMAGVINIITKRGEGPPESFVDIQGGSHETRQISVGSAGRLDRFDYSATFSHHDTAGIPALSKENGFRERDAYRNNTFSSRLGYRLTDAASISVAARYMDSSTDYDAYNAFFMQTEEGKIDKQELFLHAELQTEALNGLWEQIAGISHARLRRDYLEAPGLPDEFFKGDVFQADWQHNLYWSELQTFTFGVDWERNTAETRNQPTKETDTFGFYLQDKLTLTEAWFATLGVRLDDNDAFGSKATYRAATAYHLRDGGTRLKAAYGTGYKAPSLYELYAADMFTVGNPDLDAQTSRGWDLGIEQDLIANRLAVGATYYEIKFEDLINWVPDFDNMLAPGSYANISSATTKGLETFVAFRFNRLIAARIDYTYLEARDHSDGNAFELRRPEHQLAAGLQITPTDKLALNIRGQYVDNRLDFGDIKLDSYTLFHVAASYQLARNLTLYGRIENLFDEDYVEVAGYSTPGISGYAGIRAEF